MCEPARPWKFVGRISRADIEGGQLVRLSYPPYDVLVALVDGEPLAIEDACNHAGASLAEGTLKGARIVCPMHGYVFSMKSGELLAPRGLCAAQRTFRTKIEGDEIAIYDDFTLTVLP